MLQKSSGGVHRGWQMSAEAWQDSEGVDRRRKGAVGVGGYQQGLPGFRRGRQVSGVISKTASVRGHRQVLRGIGRHWRASAGVGGHRRVVSAGGGCHRRRWPHRLSPTNAACSFNLFLLFTCKILFNGLKKNLKMYFA